MVELTVDVGEARVEDVAIGLGDDEEGAGLDDSRKQLHSEFLLGLLDSRSGGRLLYRDAGRENMEIWNKRSLISGQKPMTIPYIPPVTGPG